MQFGGTPPAFAMVGFRQVGQLKINRERLRDPMGLIDGEAGDNVPGLIEQRVLKIC